MGSGLSKYESYQLTSYAGNPLAIIDHAFVHPGPDPLQVTIDPEASFSGHDFTITDAATNTILYHAEGRAVSASGKITLLDPQGYAICNMKADAWSSNLGKYTVFRGASSGQGENEGVAMTLKARENATNFELEVKTGTGDVLYVKTSTTNHAIYVFSGHPKAGRYLVARSGIKWSRKMRAEVAPGVDALAVVCLLILADAVREDIKARERRRRKNHHHS
ncbi:hypothetical protein BCR44DRAFT_39602 [Catenaria anguillulae PL171]|uniref:Tubby C-terminal-like domain-containing protein n=1 Tax=Catenaria anguillulae PL171 TaxID=765915 RepID=A0A1Y2HSL4_9FUNG|nr:hypothetical protein BCR44DRAFT_39602 [Catenaria anguillulae PL171]